MNTESRYRYAMNAQCTTMGPEFDGENPRRPYAVGLRSEPATVVRGSSLTDHEHVVPTHEYQTDQRRCVRPHCCTLIAPCVVSATVARPGPTRRPQPASFNRSESAGRIKARRKRLYGLDPARTLARTGWLGGLGQVWIGTKEASNPSSDWANHSIRKNLHIISKLRRSVDEP